MQISVNHSEKSGRISYWFYNHINTYGGDRLKGDFRDTAPVPSLWGKDSVCCDYKNTEEPALGIETFFI